MTEQATARVVRAALTEDPVSAAELARAVEDRSAGAVVTFDGRVRDHDDGLAVTGITYSAHPSAERVLAEIAAELAVTPGLRAVGVTHRVGELGVGDAALVVAVSADHRQEAFEALTQMVDEVKRRVPVWKCQHFADGSRQWSNLG